jgi:hypothetical protein
MIHRHAIHCANCSIDAARGEARRHPTTTYDCSVIAETR